MKRIYDDPAYQAAQKKLDELRQKEQTLSHRIETLKAKRRDDHITRQARLLIQDKEFAITADETDPLFAELRVVKKAVQLSETTLQETRRKVAEGLCRHYESEAKARAKETYVILVKLAEAVQNEVKFFQELDGAGLTVGYRPAHWVMRPFVRDSLMRGYPLSSANSPVGKCLREYQEFWKL